MKKAGRLTRAQILVLATVVTTILFWLFFGYIVFSFFRDWQALTVGKGENQIFEKGRPLRFAITGTVTPTATYSRYDEFIRYLSKRMGRSVILIQRRSQKEIDDLIHRGAVDIAFLGIGGYVTFPRDELIELLVVPLLSKKRQSYSYIIVREDSGIKTFEDFRQRSFAFADPLSLSGTAYPTYLVKKMGSIPEIYFSKIIYTFGHDNSIEAVRRGLVDGAAVESLVFDLLASKEPERVHRIKIILESPPLGMPPIVVRTNLNSKSKAQLKAIFLTMHQDDEGRKILKKLLFDKFVVGSDEMYSLAREIISFTEE